jgi:uncharacterized metal-binding protein YceD (DUF177 family)
MTGHSEEKPLSRPFPIKRLSAGPVSVRLETTADERVALARFLDIPAVESLSADLVVTPRSRGNVHVTGSLEAEVMQTCVVTLEPVTQSLSEPIEMTFSPDAPPLPKPGQEIERGLDEVDPPELLTGESIDLGAVVAEFLALGLDPFPRRADAQMPDEALIANDPLPSPFAALSQLKPKN